MSVFDKAKKVVKKAVNKATGNNNVWDMSTKENREKQVKRDYEYAKIQRASTTERFVEMDNYYNNLHYTARQAAALAEKYHITQPPVLPDAYIQVESQIEPDVPDFQFKGRDDDLDSVNAKVREEVVRFVCYNNHLDDMNPDQERSLGKLGNALWKVAFDGSIEGPGYVGDLTIGNPDPANIFPDPSAYDIDDCEFIIYAFRMHRRAARRKFGKIIDDIANDANYGDTEIYSSTTRDMFDDTMQVIEYWYRDDDGDIACTIQVGEKEVKHIPKYWVNTLDSGNKMYPFVKYCKIPNAKSFWDKSEIETIKDLIDAQDREFMNAIMNDSMLGNDIVLHEKDAFAPDYKPPNMPGAKWEVMPNKINAVRRLGGISNNTNALNMINFIHDKIEETNGNFATKGGDPPARINTASGLAMIREDREARGTPKKIDRMGGFRRLYELIDWSVLEFYNQDRIILIRGKSKTDTPTVITFNSEKLKMPVPKQANPIDFQQVEGGEEEQRQEQTYYFPRIDCEIQVGQGIAKSPALTLQATQELAGINVTPVNVELVCSMVDQMGLNDGETIKDSLRQAIQASQQPAPGAGGETVPEEPPVPEVDPEEMLAFLHSLPEEMTQFIMENTPNNQIPQVAAQLMQMPPEQVDQMTPDQLIQIIGGMTNG